MTRWSVHGVPGHAEQLRRDRQPGIDNGGPASRSTTARTSARSTSTGTASTTTDSSRFRHPRWPGRIDRPGQRHLLLVRTCRTGHQRREQLVRLQCRPDHAVARPATRSTRPTTSTPTRGWSSRPSRAARPCRSTARSTSRASINTNRQPARPVPGSEQPAGRLLDRQPGRRHGHADQRHADQRRHSVDDGHLASTTARSRSARRSTARR